MRGRLLFQTVLFGLFVLLTLSILVIHLIGDEPAINTVLVEAVALMSINWVMILVELGRRRGGRVSAPWTLPALGLPVLTLVLWLLSLASGSSDAVERVIGGVMVAGAFIATPGAVVANHRHRLGLPKVR